MSQLRENELNKTILWNRIVALFSNFPVEKKNQQNYTEILNMTIFTNNLQRFFLILITGSLNASPGLYPKRSLSYANPLRITKKKNNKKVIFTRKLKYNARTR